jgi:hypothetical protein
MGKELEDLLFDVAIKAAKQIYDETGDAASYAMGMVCKLNRAFDIKGVELLSKSSQVKVINFCQKAIAEYEQICKEDKLSKVEDVRKLFED